jgi:hypothetical protein
MKSIKYYSIICALILTISVNGQVVDMSTAVHLSTTSQCGGTFIDAPGNYTNNFERAVSICPSIPGQYVSVTFTSFDTQAGGDVLFAFNGDFGGTLIGTYSGTPALPFTITSSDPNGCLSFRFTTNAITTRPGWSAIVTCSAVPGANPPGGSPQDCVGGQGMTICSNNTFSANSGGVGLQELSATNRGCLSSNERQSSWYYFSPTAPGFVAFTISPQNGGDDYDFAIWGPYPSITCPYISGDLPTRCSYSALTGNTGLLNGAGDNSEGAGGDKFVEDLNVLAGEVYVMVIDNFSVSGQPFDLIFTPGSAPLDCTPLPVVLLGFNGKAQELNNLLTWSTASETNNQYFTVEKSDDAINWNELGRVTGAGNSNDIKNYSLVDPVPFQTTYYRLTQTDYNGTKTTFQTISVERSAGGIAGEIMSFYPNPVSEQVFIQTYMDGENKISILDQTGKVVFNTIINGQVAEPIELTSLSSGLYFIHIENNGKVQNEKIIVRK